MYGNELLSGSLSAALLLLNEYTFQYRSFTETFLIVLGYIPWKGFRLVLWRINLGPWSSGGSIFIDRFIFKFLSYTWYFRRNRYYLAFWVLVILILCFFWRGGGFKLFQYLYHAIITMSKKNYAFFLSTIYQLYIIYQHI